MKNFGVIPIALAVLSGCNSAGENKEAIRQGVIAYVSAKVNVGAMDVDVTSIAFKENEADATVSFRAKGSSAGSGLQMRYTLEKKSGKWVVKDKAEAGSSPHGAAAGSMDRSDDPHGNSGRAMPPGHPPLGAGEARK